MDNWWCSYCGIDLSKFMFFFIFFFQRMKLKIFCFVDNNTLAQNFRSRRRWTWKCDIDALLKYQSYAVIQKLYMSKTVYVSVLYIEHMANDGGSEKKIMWQSDRKRMKVKQNDCIPISKCRRSYFDNKKNYCVETKDWPRASWNQLICTKLLIKIVVILSWTKWYSLTL